MILELPKEKVQPNPKDWHMFWCIRPRIIDNKLIWLSRAERRLIKIKESYDGAIGATYRHKVWEYHLQQCVLAENPISYYYEHKEQP